MRIRLALARQAREGPREKPADYTGISGAYAEIVVTEKNGGGSVLTSSNGKSAVQSEGQNRQTPPLVYRGRISPTVPAERLIFTSVRYPYGAVVGQPVPRCPLRVV